MKVFYFQEQPVNEDWENAIPTPMHFHNREKAIEFAVHLADYTGKKIRVTDNWRLDEGTYIHPKRES